MLNKFFNNKINSSLFLSLIMYILLNILAYFHWEQEKNIIDKFDKTSREILQSNDDSDKQFELKKQTENYGIEIVIYLIPISLFIGFLQFIVFENITKRFYKVSDTQAKSKK